MLRSVSSRWQTGWRSASALADLPLMIIRSRIFITAVLVCHVLLADRVVTSQTPPPPPHPSSPPVVAKRKEDVTIRAVEQEKEGVIYHLRGNGEILYRNYILRADKLDYNSD